MDKNELTNLAKTEIPANLVRTLPGNKPYLPWRTVADLLDHAVGEGGWNTEVVRVERIEGLESPLASVIVRLNVWIGEQVFSRESVGTESMVMKKRDGGILDQSETAYLKAERTAFKRAAGQFGLCLAGEDEPAYEPRQTRQPSTAPATNGHAQVNGDGFEHVGQYMQMMYGRGHAAKDALRLAGEALAIEVSGPSDIAGHLKDERLLTLVKA